MWVHNTKGSTMKSCFYYKAGLSEGCDYYCLALLVGKCEEAEKVIESIASTISKGELKELKYIYGLEVEDYKSLWV